MNNSEGDVIVIVFLASAAKVEELRSPVSNSMFRRREE